MDNTGTSTTTTSSRGTRVSRRRRLGPRSALRRTSARRCRRCGRCVDGMGNGGFGWICGHGIRGGGGVLLPLIPRRFTTITPPLSFLIRWSTASGARCGGRGRTSSAWTLAGRRNVRAWVVCVSMGVSCRIRRCLSGWLGLTFFPPSISNTQQWSSASPRTGTCTRAWGGIAGTCAASTSSGAYVGLELWGCMWVV